MGAWELYRQRELRRIDIEELSDCVGLQAQNQDSPERRRSERLWADREIAKLKAGDRSFLEHVQKHKSWKKNAAHYEGDRERIRAMTENQLRERRRKQVEWKVRRNMRNGLSL